MSLRQKLYRGGMWASAGKLIAIGCSFLLNLILARSLSPADYGAYFVALNTMMILTATGTVGMDQIVVRFVAMNLRSNDWPAVRMAVARCLEIAAAGTLIVAVALWLYSDWFFGKVLHVPQVHAYIGLVVIWLVASLLSRQLSETFRGFNDIRSATMYGSLRANGILLSIATCLPLLPLLGRGLIDLRTVFVVMACGSVFVLAAAARTLVRDLRRGGGEAVHANPAAGEGLTLPRALAEGWPLWLAMLAVVFNNQGTGWLAGIFDTPNHVALFGVAQRFVLLLIAPMQIVNALLPPIIAELHHASEMKRLEHVAQTVAGLASLPCLGIFLVLIVAGKFLLGVLFGSFYEGAYAMLIVLCAGQLANIATGSWQIVLPMTGHRRQTLFLSLLTLALQLISGCAGGYYLGVWGVAVSSCLTIVAVNLLGMLVVRRYLGIWTFVTIRRDVLKDVIGMIRKGPRRRGAPADTSAE